MAKNGLRVLFIAGGLGKGGAEKQLIYMLRALTQLGAEVQVMTLTEGEFHENTLAQMGIRPIFAGTNPAGRIFQILQAAQSFRPHFLQASHFFASFYAGAVGRLAGIPSIGAVRSDLYLDLEGVGRMGPWILRLPTILLANSNKARENAARFGLPDGRVQVLPNAIDLDEFDSRMAANVPEHFEPGRVRAVTVARLVPVKRLERFLQALAIACALAPQLQGVIIGSGPEEAGLRALAERLGLQPNDPEGGVRFLGERGDVPQLLAHMDLFVLTSDREGFPNVFLEAMAASLPILSTPAGETRELVIDGVNGSVVPFNDEPQFLAQAFANHLVQLAQSPDLRHKLGSEGRRMVERQYGFSHLGANLLQIYRVTARQSRSRAALAVLEGSPALEHDLPAVLKHEKTDG